MEDGRTVFGDDREQHSVAYAERDRMPAALLICCAAPAAAAYLLAFALVVVIATCAAPSSFLRISTCLELLRTLVAFSTVSKQKMA